MNQKRMIGIGILVIFLALGGYVLFQRQGEPKEVIVNFENPFDDLVIPAVEDPVTKALYEEKFALTKKMWEEKPDIWETWIAIGNLYVLFGQYEEGIVAFKQSIVAHSNILAHRNIATVYMRDLKNYQKAEEHYRLALNDDFSDVSIYIDLANLQKLHLKNPKAAEEALLLGLSKATSKQDIYVQLIELYESTGQIEKQKEMVKILLEKFPEERYKAEWGHLVE